MCYWYRRHNELWFAEKIRDGFLKAAFYLLLQTTIIIQQTEEPINSIFHSSQKLNQPTQSVIMYTTQAIDCWQ